MLIIRNAKLVDNKEIKDCDIKFEDNRIVRILDLGKLYSAMSGITRKNGFRFGGIVESAYLFNQLMVKVIADGFHLLAELLQLILKHIGEDRVCLISDAMRGAGQIQGESILGSLTEGQRVIIEDGVAKMPDRQAFQNQRRIE